jgi:putative oxidoreductase
MEVAKNGLANKAASGTVLRFFGTSINALLPWLQSALQLGLRLYMAKAFFLAGLTKIRDWETTLLLFTDEYKVPLLSPSLAAVMGTGGELVLPVLLALGLAGRFGAMGLFFMNIVAVISYPSLAEAARQEHFYWGVMLAVLALFGSGKFSVDGLLLSRWWNVAAYRQAN